MTYRQSLWFWCVFVPALLFSSLARTQETPEALSFQDTRPDVRVLIDISGSMKQNDPLNLRRPALELLVQLFPEDSKAGVWTFGQWVNNLVPSAPVTDSWRARARGQAQKINSVALHTNIPEALRRAMLDEELDPAFQTHFILLTDGMVDVSQEPAENTAARERMLDELLPQLRDAGIKIHTVALSQNADSELMERLALETGGLAAVAESADDLMRIFLQAFDAAAPAEEVPLQDNRFLVDSSIEEFTALVFRKADSQPTVLVSPEQQRYSRGSKHENVRWFSQQNYDLITVQQPFEGEWLIQADLEPDSRVTIVSNLSLKVNRLPKGYFIGNDMAISAVLEEQGEVVTRPEFLDLVDVGYEVVRRGDGERWISNLSDLDPRPGDGIFREPLTVLKQPGLYDIIVTANGKTFQRQQKQTLEARRNFIVTSAASDTVPPEHTVTVTSKNPRINTDSLKITATLDSPLGDSRVIPLRAITERSWQFEFAGAEQSTRYQVALDIVGLYSDGSPLRTSEALQVEHFVPGTEFVAAEPEPEPEPEPAAEPPPAPEPDVANEGVNWGQIGLYVGLGVGNLLVLLLGYFAYKTVTGGGTSEVLEAEDELAPPMPEDDMELEATVSEEPAEDDFEPAGGELPDSEPVEEVDIDAEDDDIDVDEEAPDDLGDALDLPDDAMDLDPDKP